MLIRHQGGDLATFLWGCRLLGVLQSQTQTLVKRGCKGQGMWQQQGLAIACSRVIANVT